MTCKIKISTLALSLVFPLLVFSAALPSTPVEQVPLSLFSAQEALQEKMPNQFQVLVWNIHKAADKKMLPDFANLSKFASLSLFQESIDQESWMTDLKKENREMDWALARSFETNDHYFTGVATGSRIQASLRLGFRSQPTEPVTNTPKTMLLSEYHLENGKTLRVLNVHAINFVTNSQFNIQVDQIVSLLKNYKGPLIVAGDFNTWNQGRKDFLIQSLSVLGLKHVELNLRGLLQLDHVFIRDLNLVRSNVFQDIDSSDHKPILVELSAP